ncbi:hypothetical protein D7W81_11940 [Corallococcus aberystwythensis]|uniref:Uncharacterized protein n=1 Tax=Corallococcus aberystwythensis TaxID=2316722 RepID=A0A3A8QJI4_9BACT|nr:hypothetical protein D7W81_11940 [Corallococcus aberystwythensis]
MTRSCRSRGARAEARRSTCPGPGCGAWSGTRGRTWRPWACSPSPRWASSGRRRRRCGSWP